MHRIRNYGSFLQAYALKRLLERMGCRVKYIDIETIQRPVERKNPVVSALGKLKYIDRNLLRRLRFQKSRSQVREVFETAQKEYLGLSGPAFSTEDCDAVVIGSDEIFNCDSNGKFKMTAARFGDLPGVPRVITYAASCGYTSLKDTAEKDLEAIARGIQNLDAISVRDENTASFVSNFRKTEVLRHLDPVLVYGFEEELASVDPAALPKKPYMVVYAYHNRINSKEEIKAIRSYAKNHGLKTIAVGSVQAWCDEYAVLTPFEVLAYFQNAACIVTDTFHGTVMSAKYQKPFAVMVRDSNANKLEDLLARLKLQDHKVCGADKLPAILDHPSDYAACSQILKAEQVRTETFLRSALMP